MFHNNIKEKRQELGLSQTKLSRLAEIGQANLSSLETGKVKPWPKAKRDLARVLGVSEGDLFPEE